MIEKCLLFLCPVRTGHTLISSLLNFHENIAMSIEYNLLNKFIYPEKHKKLSKNKMFSKVVKDFSIDRSVEKGGYEYEIKNMKKDIKVIGDSMAGVKYNSLLYKDDNYEEFLSFIELPIYFISVYRNPFDVIQSSHEMNNCGIGYNTSVFLYNMHLIEKLVNENTFTLYLEDFIDDPKLWLKNILSFLELECSDNYLNLCSKKVFSKPNKRFIESEWTPQNISLVNDFIYNNTYLKRYYNEFQTVDETN